MAKTQQNIGTDSDPYYRGDTLEVVVTVTEDGSEKSLSGASVEWALSSGPGQSEELNESDAGVSVAVTDAAAGEITLTIDAGATDDIEPDTWYHEFRVEDGSGKKSVVTRGKFTISERVNA